MTWDALKDKELTDSEKYDLLIDFDKVFGLSLSSIKPIEEIDSKYLVKTTKDGIPVWTSDTSIFSKEIMELIESRNEARKRKEWDKSDEIRKEIEKKGWQIEDSGEKTIIKEI
jgi:cysteinyl-tRNA synthetase